MLRKERLRDFLIVHFAEAVNAWVHSAFGNVYFLFWDPIRKTAHKKEEI